ncbi:type II secretion system protein [Candidatus Saccharibacteria bacterium]|nr:type II secretion system protein [Candidatus Saccharibacteria bacterium]
MERNKKGFTILEVVLVLAIAGLIFVMVFIAMPALRRNQRDQVRVRNISTIISLMDQYRSHNKGRMPGTNSTGKPCVGSESADCDATTELNKYLDSYAIELTEPTHGDNYIFTSAGSYGDSCLGAAEAVSEFDDYRHIGFCYETTCASDDMEDANSFQKADNNYVFSIIYRKEVGGLICQDNRG